MYGKYSQRLSRLYGLIIVCSVGRQGKWNSKGTLGRSSSKMSSVMETFYETVFKPHHLEASTGFTFALQKFGALKEI